jgi:hypothetical protein
MLAGLTAVAPAIAPSVSAAQNSTPCAWPYELSPYAAGNWAWPDTNARYWMMPLDSQWVSMTINGIYPTARYMSFVTYDGAVINAVHDGIYDTEISPDAGSLNPFVTPGSGGAFTVTVTRGAQNGANTIHIGSASGWVIYRIYLPDDGQSSTGGVSLPNVTLADGSGNTQTLMPCSEVNKYADTTALVNQFYPFSPNPIVPASSSDQLLFAPPAQPPAILAPNPDNKYVGMFPGAYQPGRIIVIRGKAPIFPDSYNGGPVWQPSSTSNSGSIQVRYWTMCINDSNPPYPVVQCMPDVQAKLDASGFYTVVISDDRIAPSWLPANANWLSWGDEQQNKFVFYRNMLPADGFQYSVQNAIAQGCTYPLDFPNSPDPAAVKQAATCTQSVMGDYYPVAVWCDKATFLKSGWQGCQQAQGGTLWTDATDMGNDWKWLNWFGYFNTGNSPWIYHPQLGWLSANGTSSAGIWFYDPAMQGGSFWWTSATTFPNIYRASDGVWLVYKIGSSNPRLFLNLSTNKWESD